MFTKAARPSTLPPPTYKPFTPPPENVIREERVPPKEQTLYFKGDDPKEKIKDKPIPKDMDPITFKHDRLKVSHELLVLKKALTRSTKEKHYDEVIARAKKLVTSLKKSKALPSLRDQAQKLITRAEKHITDTTQKRRIRRLVRKDFRRKVRSKR